MSPRFAAPAIAVALLLVGLGAVHVTLLRPGHEWGDDFAMYLLHARNLVEGRPYAETGYLYNSGAASIGPPSYPPMTAVLLAPVYACTGLDLQALKGVMVGCLLVFLGCVALLFRRRLPAWAVLALVAALGMNWFFLRDTNTINSDEPLLAFLYLSLLLMDQVRDEAVAMRHRLVWAAALGVAMCLAFQTRTLGALLVPSLMAEELWNACRIRRPALLALGIFAVLSCGQMFWLKSQWAYLDQLGPRGSERSVHVLAYVERWAAFFSNGYSHALAAAVFVLVTLLAALGYWRRARSRLTALEIFLALYLAVVLLWPGYQAERYLYPILPLWLYYALEGLLHPWFASRPLLWRTLAVGLALVVAGSYAFRYTRLDFGPVEQGVTSPNAAAMFEYVARHTAAADVVVFPKPRAMALFARRTASACHMAANDAELWRYFSRIGARHLVVVQRDEALGRAADPIRCGYLRDFVGRNSRWLREEYTNPDFRVLEIQVPIAETGCSCKTPI